MKIDELRLLKKDIITKYYEGLPLVEIGKLFTSRKSSIKTILEEEGIEINPHGAVKNRALNHNYFEEIDSSEKAYFIGFLFADGSVYWRQRKSTKNAILQLEVGIIDRHIVESFLKAINANYNLHEGRGTVSVKITSNKLVEDLEKHNIVPNKTYEIKSLSKHIPKQFERDFLRGSIDGDGSIYFETGNSNKRISFVSYSEEATTELQHRIDALIEKTNHSKVSKKTSGYYVTWSGRLQTEKILSILYYPECISLSRKFEKAIFKI